MSSARLAAFAILLSIICACGGGGDGGSAPSAGTPVTLYYPSGRIAAQGFYADGTTTRTGAWTEYFDQAGSPKQWNRSYAAGVWDQAAAWREFNADGSTRDDRGDL